jgi:hypothetical protein
MNHTALAAGGKQMTMSNTPGVPASAAPLSATRSVGVLLRKGVRSPWLSVALLVLVATGAFLLGRSSAPASFDQQLPPHVAVPAHARLVRLRTTYRRTSRTGITPFPGVHMRR